MRVKLDNPDSVSRIKTALQFGAVAVEFLADGTRFELILAPSTSIADAEDIGMSASMLLVALPNFGSTYCFHQCSLHASYVEQKLNLCPTDATHLTALLNAVFYKDGAQTYLAEVVEPGTDRVKEGHSLYVR